MSLILAICHGMKSGYTDNEETEDFDEVCCSSKQAAFFYDFSYVVVLKCDTDDIFENGRTHKLRSCVAENPSELLLEALVRATAGGNFYLRLSNNKLFWIFWIYL